MGCSIVPIAVDAAYVLYTYECGVSSVLHGCGSLRCLLYGLDLSYSLLYGLDLFQYSLYGLDPL
jgi:hypothetical protein